LEVFEKYALEYDQWFKDHAVEYEQELKAIRSLLPKEGRGIEIGAGTGRFTKPLGVSLGIEPSNVMREIAISRGINIVAGTAESIPVDDDLYDYALMVTTVCFLDTTEIAFREVHRILKVDGYIIVGLIDRDSKLGRKYEESENKFYRDARFHSVNEVKRDLNKSGFTNIEYVQAILPGDEAGNYEPKVKQGYGEGSFVVLRGQRAET